MEQATENQQQYLADLIATQLAPLERAGSGWYGNTTEYRQQKYGEPQSWPRDRATRNADADEEAALYVTYLMSLDVMTFTKQGASRMIDALKGKQWRIDALSTHFSQEE